MRAVAVALLFVFALSALAACGEPAAREGGANADAAADDDVRGPWTYEVVWTSPVKVGGCAVGDADPDREGLEIVAVDIEGRVHVLYREGDGWGHVVAAETGGEKIQCAVGDLRGVFPGNTIAAVGMAEGTEDDGGAGAVVLVGKTAEGWRSQPLDDVFPALVHGVAIADVDPEVPGDELAVTGFDKTVALFAFEDGEPRGLARFPLHAPGKGLAARADTVLVAAAGPRFEWVTRRVAAEGSPSTASGWQLQEVATDLGRPARIDVTDDGRQVLLASDDGRLRWAVVEPGENPVPTRVVYAEDQKLRGAALGDFDPDRPGLELATAGYEGRVTVIVPGEGGTFEKHVVYRDDARLHHLAAGDLLPGVRGDELVTCGYSGRVAVVRRK